MSDKAKEKKEEAPKDAKAEGEGAAKKAPIWTKLPVLLGGVMVLEAAVLFGVFKVMGGGTPKSAKAEVELAKGEEPAGAAGAHGEEPAKAEAAHGEAPAGHGESSAGNGDAAGGHGGGGGGTAPKGSVAEIEVTSFRAPNIQTGRRFIYDVAIFVSVKNDNKIKVEAILKERKATIEDRIRTIIAQSEPDKLGGGSEPGLETLRRQVKVQIEEIAGDGTVLEVLIPRCIPFRGD